MGVLIVHFTSNGEVAIAQSTIASCNKNIVLSG